MKLHEIRAKRTAVAAEMRGLLDKADSETRALTADEASKFDALKSEVNDLDAAEERAATLEEIERIRAAVARAGLHREGAVGLAT